MMLAKGAGWIVVVIAATLSACARRAEPARASYVPVVQLEATYGRLITAGNHPTPDQHGTGDRIGLFLDHNGTVWGLPLIVTGGGAVLGCAPPALRSAETTDTYPQGATIIGATNEPTGWRGGTGRLELLLRDRAGGIEWRAVRGGHMPTGNVCWAQDLPGPPQQLQYYRLAPAPAGK